MKPFVYAVALIALFLGSCSERVDEGYVMTVRGAVPAAEMGRTLSHEHVMVDWIGADSTGYHRWDKDSVIMIVLPYLEEISGLGVSCFADCSPAYLGRDPWILRELSERTGMHIITNTGYYGAVGNRFIPGYAWDESAEELAARWTGEFANGIDGSGVKPGFIKIGVKEDSPLSDLHRKLIRAAALTHKQTGLTIKSHTGGDIPAFDQLAVLENEGVSPSAFIWTHAQAGSIEKNLEAARLGAWISLDAVNVTSGREPGGSGNLEWYIERLAALKEAGVLNRVLISHDAGWYDAGEPGGGGYREYSDIPRYLLPEMVNRGFTDNDIEQLMELNPAEAFAVNVRLSD